MKVRLDKDGNIWNDDLNLKLDTQWLRELIVAKTGATVTWVPSKRGENTILATIHQGYRQFGTTHDLAVYMKSPESIGSWQKKIKNFIDELIVWSDSQPEETADVSFD